LCYIYRVVAKVTTFFYYKIFISMIYNEKIQNLLEALDGKLRIIQNVANGAQILSPSEINTTIEDARKIVERVSELVSINR
jgi:hypothetical protein